jgi:type IV pilus assembly protein PilY1
MNNNFKKNKFIGVQMKVVSFSLSAVFTALVASSVTQASDIQIYQNPTAKNFPILMLAIDNSTSMTANDAIYKNSTVTRMAALQKSLVDALNAKDASGNYKIPSTAYIGISTFTASGEYGISADWTLSGTSRVAKILVPARKLTDTHRSLLISRINGISAVSSTPTPLLLSETYAYLLGTKTHGVNLIGLDLAANTTYSNYSRGLSGFTLAPLEARILDDYIPPLNDYASGLSAGDAQCSTQGVFFLTDGAPVGLRPATVLPVMRYVLDNQSFTCDNSPLEDVYYNFSTAKAGQTSAVVWNGEFKEMATLSNLIRRNIARNDAGNSGSNQSGWQNRSSWSCIGKLVSTLANQDQFTSTAKNKRIYTATVGFGPLFKKHVNETCDGDLSYCTFNNSYTGANSVDVSNYLNALALQKLGNEIGKGDTYGTSNEIGGYKEATSGEDVQTALETFLGSVSASNFESASFGTYVIPSDSLSSTAYQYVFAPQFQPKISGESGVVQSTQQLWLGNLKKYKLNSVGAMVDSQGITILNDQGSIKSNSKDFWNKTNYTDGSDALKGGVLPQLKVPQASSGLLSQVTNVENINTRPLFMNAEIGASGGTVVQVNALNKVTSKNVLAATQKNTSATGWRQNLYQPYLLSALGYNLTKTYLDGMGSGNANTFDLAKIKALDVSRQIGGVIHSDPILVTSEAPVDDSGNVLFELKDVYGNVKSARKDYIIFGSLQGILHMVDQGTGEEVFSFLPNEILQDSNRRDALLEVSNTQRLTTNPYYGVDAPWTSWVDYEYTEDQNDKFYVEQAGSTSGKLTYMRKFKAAQANIYGGLRMGGRSYYGLDVKDPANPKFLFQIDAESGLIRSSTTGISTTTANPALQAMGQSWSKPTIAKVRINNKIRNVMIVGGGYDYEVHENSNKPASWTNDKGAGVYIFDAETGQLLWNARYDNQSNVSTVDVKNSDLKYSVVSQIKVFDRNADGLVDNLYFGDLGGQIFRVDLNNTYNTQITDFGRVNRLADFSAMKQKFYEMPALSIHEEEGARFGVISIGSGNRSFPLNISNQYDNRIYVLYDKDLASNALFTSGYVKTANITENDLIQWDNISSTNIADLRTKTKKGWYYILRSTKAGQLETVNTGTVKAFNGYSVVANTSKYSDLYVSLYNPKHSSTQQPNACSGGITGASVVTKFCLPYGICGDASNSTNITANKNVSFVSNAVDGFSKVNAGGFNTGSKNLVTMVPGVGQNYQMSKIFRSSNWREIQ